MLDSIRPAITTLAFMTLLVGVAYPLTVTGVAHLAFPDQAAGSLVRDDAGQVRGSRLIAQAFDGDQWFQPRPSAGDYATVASAASNLAPSNPKLRERIEQASAKLSGQAPVPMQLLTTSGSGLDPHLSPEAAAWQIPRIAQTRGLNEAELLRLVETYTERPLFGPAVVNVLALNLALVDNPSTSSQ